MVDWKNKYLKYKLKLEKLNAKNKIYAGMKTEILDLNKLLKKCYYGIEIETCVCFNHKVGYLDIDANEPVIEYSSIANNIINEKNKIILKYNKKMQKQKGKTQFLNDDVQFDKYDYIITDEFKPVIHDEILDYTKYNIIYDPTVKCDEFDNNLPVKYYYPKINDKCTFYPIEIISKILPYNNYNDFKIIYDNVITNDNFTYMTNESQGLHVNISFENFDLKPHILKILSYWVYFEESILSFISPDRLTDINMWSKRLKGLVGPTGELVQDNWQEYYNHVKTDEDDIFNRMYIKSTAINIKHDGHYIEIRTTEGGIIYDFITEWTTFLVRFISNCILQDTLPPRDKDGNIEQLTLFIGHSVLIERKQYQDVRKTNIEELFAVIIDRHQILIEQFDILIKNISKNNQDVIDVRYQLLNNEHNTLYKLQQNIVKQIQKHLQLSIISNSIRNDYKLKLKQIDDNYYKRLDTMEYIESEF
jgi:hypothetical protein